MRTKTFLLVVALTTASLVHAMPLSGVVVRGSTEYAPNSWLNMSRDYVGRPISLSLKEEIAAAIRQRYAQDGHNPPNVSYTSLFEKDGVLLVHVSSAFIERVRITGSNAESRQKVRALVAADGIPISGFEQWLADLEDRSGVRVRGSLDPIDDDGALVATLVVLEKRWKGSLGIDNRSLAGLDENIFVGNVARVGIGGGNNSVALQAATSQENGVFDFVGLVADQSFGANRIEVGMSKTRSELENEVFNFVENYKRERVWLKYTYRVLDRTRHRLYLDAGLDGYDLDQRFAGFPVRLDQIRAADASVRYEFAPNESSTHRFAITRRQGLNDFGAGSLYGLEKLDFTIDQIRYQYDQSFGTYGAIRLNLDSQITSDVLPRAEQFSLGGARIGGAFDPAAIRGDEGMSARIEWSRPLDWQHFDLSSQVYLYADYGEATSNLPFGIDDEGTSGGLGWRARWRGLVGYVEVAHVISSPEFLLDADDTRLFFALQQRF